MSRLFGPELNPWPGREVRRVGGGVDLVPSIDAVLDSTEHRRHLLPPFFRSKKRVWRLSAQSRYRGLHPSRKLLGRSDHGKPLLNEIDIIRGWPRCLVCLDTGIGACRSNPPDLHTDAGRELKPSQSLNCALRRIDDIDQALMRMRIELLLRFFVKVR